MALLVQLFPREGATVYDEDGAVVPTTGWSYDVSLPFYAELCRRGDLLRDDPLDGSGGVPGSVPPATSLTASLIGLQVVELAANPGTADGEVKACNGYAVAGGGGGGFFSWTVGTPAVAEDGYLRINATGGQWARENTEVLDVRWYGAVGNRVGTGASAVPGNVNYQGDDATAAINLAMTAAIARRATHGSGRVRVAIRGGVFRTTAKISLPSYVTLELEDAEIHATSDCAIEMVSTTNSEVRGPGTISLAANVWGIRAIMSNSGITWNTVIENLTIEAPATGTAWGIDFQQSGSGTSGSNNHINPLVRCVTVRCTSGFNPTFGGLRVKSNTTTISQCVGGVVSNCEFYNIGYGVYLDNCDTFKVDKIHAHSITAASPGGLYGTGLLVAVVGGSNVGNGTISGVGWTGASVSAGDSYNAVRPKAGAWILRCTGAVANGGVWRLEDRFGAHIATGITMTPGVGAATVFNVAGFQFTLTDGSTDFAVGDLYTITVPDSAAVTFGPYTSLLEMHCCRFEDTERALRYIRAVGGQSTANPNIDSAIELSMKGTNVWDRESGGGGRVRHPGRNLLSETNEAIRYTQRQIIESTVELSCYESRQYTPAGTITELADDSGVISPRIRLVSNGAPGDVTINGIHRDVDRTQGDPIQGDFRIVHKVDAGSLIVTNENAGATDYKRTVTASGGTETYPGPCTVLFIYDKTRNGSGAGRYFCMGALMRPSAPRANSTAILVADLVTDFNDLLAKLRTAGLLRT